MIRRLNTRKVIWYCHPYAGSPQRGMSFRPFYLGKYFLEAHADPIIISSTNHHLLRKSVDIDGSAQLIQEEGVPYLWVNTSRYVGNGFGRVKNMLSYASFFKKHNLITEFGLKKPDVIIVSSAHPFHFNIAYKLCCKYRATLIFEVRDIWPLTLHELLGVSRLHPFYLYLKYIEIRAYSKANFIVSLLPNAKNHMLKYGLDGKRYVHIPNGVDCSNVKMPFFDIPQIKQLKEEGKFIVLYAGAHGIPNALDILLHAMKVINDLGNTKVHVILIGDGKEKTALQVLASEIKLPNITFLPSVLKDSLPSYLAIADLCYLGAKPSPIYRYGVSANKIFDYMLAEKPILQAFHSPNSPVELSQCGLCVSDPTPLKIADVILSFSSMKQKQLLKMGEDGKNYVIQHHSYKVLAEKYLRLIKR